MKTGLKVEIGGLKLENPVMVSSGTFGYGTEYSSLLRIRKLGAIVTKTVTLRVRRGNASPRIAETPSGMLNAIGLENPGLERFLSDKLPGIRRYKVPLIVSIAGDTAEEYGRLAAALDKADGVDAIEINISCPNIGGERLFAQDAGQTAEVVGAVRAATDKTVITKLSPNVTDIIPIAVAAQESGSDAVSLINTITAMGADIETRKSILGSATGGLSGPAIKPVALAMVWRAYKRLKIPVIGMGGIMDWRDAAEFMICGATAVSLGTANFVNPQAVPEAIKGLTAYLKRHKINDIRRLIGSLKA